MSTKGFVLPICVRAKISKSIKSEESHSHCCSEYTKSQDPQGFTVPPDICCRMSYLDINQAFSSEASLKADKYEGNTDITRQKKKGRQGAQLVTPVITAAQTNTTRCRIPER